MNTIQSSNMMPDDPSQHISAAQMQRERQQPKSTSSALHRSQANPLRRHALRVLIVDNDHEMADELASWLHFWGHDPHTAHDCNAAISAAAQLRPQLVLFDLEMPQAAGRQLARRLKLDIPRNSCFIIGVTCRIDDERERWSINSGIDLLLLAPVELLTLKTLLTLESARTQRLQTEACAGLIGNGDPTI